MANKKLFKSASEQVPLAEDTNLAGGKAYKFPPKHALAQLAATGTLHDTFYRTAEEQLKVLQGLATSTEITPEFVAKTAVYAREQGAMKDMPAILLAILSTRGPEGLEAFRLAFPKVITNGKMLRNLVQFIRSGVLGRKNFGSAVRKRIQNWLRERNYGALLNDSVGNDPSIGDIIKMLHPKPKNPEQNAFWGYLTGDHMNGKNEPRYNPDLLPQVIKDYEEFKVCDGKKNGEVLPAPKVPMNLLTSLPLDDSHWKDIARNGWFVQTRMNLNAYAEHGVFKDKELTQVICEKLQDREAITKSKAYPYQIMMSYLAVSDLSKTYRARGYYGNEGTTKSKVPKKVAEALQDAMEAACANVPQLPGKGLFIVDTSGSMWSPVTGNRGVGATTRVTCVDVAALFASIGLRQNPECEALAVDTRVHEPHLNARDTVMTNAEKLGKLGGGGTQLGLAIKHYNEQQTKADWIMLISDNMSWMHSGHYGGGTQLSAEFKAFKRRNKGAKLVCLDIQATGSTQAQEDKDVLNIGGFSDSTFKVVKKFLEGDLGPDHWVGEIEKVKLTDELGEPVG